MQKIISLFKRDYEGTRQVYDEVVSGAEWVINGEGVATEKIDGTSCLVQDGKLYKRFDVKKGRVQPVGFIPAQDPDPITGHWPGWVLVDVSPDNKWHLEAWAHWEKFLSDGTYELVGPKVQGNPYNLVYHDLVKHGDNILPEEGQKARDFDSIIQYLSKSDIEGIVWHHPDGRMVKIKRRDFGLPWPKKEKK